MFLKSNYYFTLEIAEINIIKQVEIGKNSVVLPASKSISNRVLILNHLASKPASIYNLSEARDTQTMERLLRSEDETLDVLDAGTTMRFLTAYISATNKTKTITGSSRMCERPIGILVEALQSIGVSINYQDKSGFPPLNIAGFETQKKRKIAIRGDVSSQYISALLMIAPILPDGLEIELLGNVGSRPYIEMTLSLMQHFGVTADFHKNVIKIKPQDYKAADITIEPDWSGASYWYSFVALAQSDELFVKDLKEESLQGDQVIVEIMKPLGVNTTFVAEGAILSKGNAQTSFEYDFTHCPDLAQTVAVVCAAKGIKCIMYGLESLKIKETDRIAALNIELKKIGATLEELKNSWVLTPSKNLPEEVTIDTYDDHRMAMAFAPLATLMNVNIKNPSVVNKSFPNFWKEIKKMGLKISDY